MDRPYIRAVAQCVRAEAPKSAVSHDAGLTLGLTSRWVGAHILREAGGEEKHDRAAGNLSAARGAARPLAVQDHRGSPESGRGARDRAAPRPWFRRAEGRGFGPAAGGGRHYAWGRAGGGDPCAAVG